MYRNYENPYDLMDEIEREEAYCLENPDDMDEYNYLQELKDRLDQAWMDEEASIYGNDY